MRRPVALLILTLLCFGSPVSISARDRSRAIELNDQGFELYEEGRFTEALELFEAAWRADDQYVYGHYNYACTLAILVREEPALWYYERDSAFEHLERTLELRPGYREKMLVDPDLSELRREFRFYSVLGFEVTDADDLAFILTTLPWYGAPTSGIYPYTAGAEFYSDGSVRFWFYTPAWFESFDEADIYRVGGSWTAQDGGGDSNRARRSDAEAPDARGYRGGDGDGRDAIRFQREPERRRRALLRDLRFFIPFRLRTLHRLIRPPQNGKSSSGPPSDSSPSPTRSISAALLRSSGGRAGSARP